LWFGVIGIIGGFVGLLYAKGFYGMVDAFARIPLPRWVRPAIGGLLVGCIALAIPEVLGTGYGWIQQSLGAHLLQIPLWIVLILPFARSATTGLSIGSGGSGGIFGPGMVIGAFVGAAVWRLLDPVVPSLGHDPAPYVIVGMMACFGSISRAPLAVMLMVAEMTGTLSLIVPAMLAVGLATLIVRRNDDTIYRSQLKSRAESPAHRILTGLPLLAQVPASEAMVSPRCVLVEPANAAIFAQRLKESGVIAAPVVDADGNYLGVVSLSSLQHGEDNSSEMGVDVSIDVTPAPVHQDTRLDVVLDILTTTPQTWATVIDDDRRVVGTIALSDIVRNYRRTTQTYLRRLSAAGGATGVVETVVADDSPIVGLPVRSPLVPRGALITSIERGSEVIRPSGDTVFQSHDRLTALGASGDLDRLVRVSTSQGPGATERE
jgi:predicted transcriptional regulator